MGAANNCTPLMRCEIVEKREFRSEIAVTARRDPTSCNVK